MLCLEHNDISLCVLSPISDYHAAWIIVTTLTEILTSHNILPLHETANCSLATCGIGTLLNIHIQYSDGTSPFPFPPPPRFPPPPQGAQRRQSEPDPLPQKPQP